MQRDEKNQEALNIKGASGVLVDFVNLLIHPENEDQSQIDRFISMDGKLDPLSYDDYHGQARIFQQVWENRSPAQVEALDRHLERIFERDSSYFAISNDTYRPAIAVDSAHHHITVKPRTMLDVLGLAMMTNLNKLAICERREDGCPTPYFIKKHSRQLFCSTDCADNVRGIKKKAWQYAHRNELIEKKRKDRAAKSKRVSKQHGKRVQRHAATAD